MYVIDTLAPVFLVIALGAALRRGGFCSAAFVRTAGRLVYWVALPALLFVTIARSSGVQPAALTVFGIVMAGTAACVAAGYVVARLLRMPARQRGAFVQAAFRGNLAYIGLAVVLYGFDSIGAAGPGARTTAALALGPIVPIYNVLAVLVLLAGQRKMGWHAVRRITWQIVTNPLLLASVAGLVWSWARWPLPTAAAPTCDVLAQAALPLALLCVGAALGAPASADPTGARPRGCSSRRRWAYALAAGTIKVGVAPLVGFAAAMAFGAGADETAISLILLACPTAVASYVLAEQLDADHTLAAAAVVVSTLLSVIALSVVVALI